MFTSYPDSGDSLWSPLIYNYETTSESDLEFIIINQVVEDDTYVKKLYDATSASINVAPLFRYSSMPKLTARTTNFYAATDGYASVVTYCQGNASSQRIFTLAKEPVSYGDMMTSMPLDRLISPGESDIIRLFTTPNQSVTAYVLAIDQEDVTNSAMLGDYSLQGDHDGVVDFVFQCPDVDNESVRVIIKYSDNTAIITYYLTNYDNLGESVRLAWLSSAGSIEHHTFPIVRDKSIYRDGTYHYTLLSAYAPELYIESIAGIVSSSMVWIIEDEEYRRIEVESEVAPIKDNGSLSYLELKIVDNG
ncbi:MAG: hypothetical protein SNJ33_06240 [Rikenellaceae bacterium]